jgi:uncharacterized protein with GYD domain
MPHYLFRASYTRQGLEGVMKEGGASRIAAVKQLVESVGGRFEAAYWALGEDDFIMIAEAPDNAAAAAAAATVGLSGAASVHTTVLMTADDIDAARARTVTYRPPGS